jgi:hypothetical protein
MCFSTLHACRLHLPISQVQQLLTVYIQGDAAVCCLQPAKAPPRVFMLRFKEQSDRDKLFW